MVDFSNVDIVSYNVNGIRSESKRRTIFNFLKTTKAKIILLQETHSLPGDESIWSNEWGSKIIFSHGSNFSKGTAILFHRDFPYKVENVRLDINGRYILLEINIDSLACLLVNVYGPNNDDPDFYIKLFDLIDSRENGSMILAGDFNVSMDPDKDLFNNAGKNHIQKRKVIQEYINTRGLVDIWRIKHPEDKTFTWRNSESRELIMSRLDYFFVSHDLVLRTNKVDIKPKFFSDHSRIVLNLDFATHKRGKGYWRFNNLLLKDPDFLKLMNNTILKFRYEVKSQDESPLDVQWEKLKEIMRKVSKAYAIEKSTNKTKLIEQFEKRLLNLDKKLIESTDRQEISQIKWDIQKTENFLLDENEEKVKSACFRSKAQYFLYGEKSSKYFFNLERSRGNSKYISKLVREDGSIIKDPKKLLQEERIFYKKLYGVKETTNWTYVNKTEQILDDQEQAFLEKDITDEELAVSLMGMNNSKTPGLDGLSADFYKVFWQHFKDLYCNAIRFMIDRGFLHFTARKGVIVLLPKKDRNLDHFKNWRPLTMLNVDYKILSRLVALRIKTKIHKLVSEDQTGFIQGRSISQNLRTTLDIIQIARNKQLQMVLVSLDWEKCFDRMTFSAIDKALEFFNFGHKFRKMVQVLLLDSSSCVLNNGHFSEQFTCFSGAKQGANVSPLLYNLLSEVLSIQIRANKDIRGICLGDTERKLIQFADDLTLFLQFEVTTLMQLEDTLSLFEGATGLKVNYDKTCLYRIGSLAQTNAKIFTRKPYVWTNGPIKILGIYIDHNSENMSQLNISNLLVKTQNICESWHFRGISLLGKVTVINFLCASLFVYRLSVLNTLDNYQVEQYVAIIKSFIWNKGKSKIAIEKLYNSREYGELQLVNLKTKDLALKCQWVALVKESPNLQELCNQFLPSIGQDIWVCNFGPKDACQIVVESPFWLDVIKAWALMYSFEPDNVSKIIAQCLWYNSNIKINKKLVYYSQAHKQGIMFLYNIWNSITNQFLSYEHMCQVYGNCMSYLEYYGLLASIPRAWISELKEARFILQDYVFPYENFVGKMTLIVYNQLTFDKNRLNKLCDKWSDKMGYPLDFDLFLQNFMQVYKLTKSSKLRGFQYRFLHRIIFTADILYKWKLVDSPICHFCETDYETVDHLFYTCKITSQFWRAFHSWYESQTNTEVEISKENIYFCNHEDDLLNTLLLLAKQYIINRKSLERPLNIHTFKEKMYEIIRIERYEAFLCKRFKPFYTSCSFIDR